MPLLESAVEALEIDQFSSSIPDYVYQSKTALAMFQEECTNVSIANITSGGDVQRPAWRPAMRIQGGSPVTQGTGDNDSIGQGTAGSYASFALSPVWLQNVTAISQLAMMATKGKQRGVIEIQAKELKYSIDSMLTGVDAAVNGDGSGSMLTIPSTAAVSSNSGSGVQTSFISGINATCFTDQQVLEVFPSIGGTSRGSFTVSFSDGPSQTIYSSTALPAGTQVGDLLALAGSSGAAGSSILGIRYWNGQQTTGNKGGLPVANYPGRLSATTINLDGGGLTVNIGNRANVILGRALGPDSDAIDSAVWYGSPDQLGVAVANQYYNVQISGAVESQVKSDKAGDLGKKYFSDTFCGRKAVKSWSADNSRLDLLTLDLWQYGSMRDIGLLDFAGNGGMTVVPVPDTSTTTGTYKNAIMFSYVIAFQLCNTSPRGNLFVQQIAEPQIG